jgi:flagellar M-ring protein FliF
VRLDPQSEEQTEERWDPASPVVRSKQTTSEIGPGASSAGGLAGTRANLPLSSAEAKAAGTTPSAGTPAAAPVVPSGPGRMAETVNFEVSRTTRHTARPRGNIARLSVAVILDDVVKETKNATGQVTRTAKARDRAEIQKIHGLVSAAVGLDAARGDVLTVENIAFDEPIVEELPPPSLWEKWGPLVLEVSRVLAVLLLGVFGFLFFVRPMMRRLSNPGPEITVQQQGQLPRTIEDLEGEIGAQLDAAVLSLNPENRKMPVLTKRLAALTQTEPDSAAKLMRAWLNEEGR